MPFLVTHPTLEFVARAAYGTSFYQPFVAVVLLALFSKRSDNARLLTAMVMALLITVVPHTLWPSIGPAPAHNIPNAWTDVVMHIRAGQMQNLPYVGIITFPSFHASMAVLFTLAYRNIPAAALAAAVVNILMIISVPYPGGHYFVDVPAGVMIAVIAWWTASATISSLGGA